MKLHRVLALWVFLFLAAAAAPALAQDYTVTRVTGKWVAPPSSATTLPLSSHSATNITLPFEFPYFGNTYTTARVGDEGWMQIGPTRQMNSTSSRSFPNPTYDGLLCPAWIYHLHASSGQVKSHTSGTAPNRVFYITWNGAGSPGIYAQVQLHESSGRVIFAYNGGSWTSYTRYEGMQAPTTSDQRYMLTDGSNSGKTTAPGSDYQFDPVATRFTGTLVMDRPTADATGIGNATLTSVPVGGARIELVHSSSGGVVGYGVTDANGAFTVSGLALNSTGGGKLRVSTQGDVAIVTKNSSSKPSTLDLNATVQFGRDASVGTLGVTATNDSSGAIRGALNILTVLQHEYEFAAARTADTIPPINVWFDQNDPSTTRFTKATSTAPAVLRIGGAASGNSDEWDDDVIGRIYGVHVFDAIAGTPTGQYDLAYDPVTDATNALGVGFGYYLRAAVAGEGQFVDALDGSAADVLDLESDSPDTAPSADVAGWVAQALYDALDADDEEHDWLDGTSDDPGRIFDAVDSLPADAIDCRGVFDAYIAGGGDGVGIARDFIHHGLLADDDGEANDTFDEALPVGTAGVRVDGLFLNSYNEDWYVVSIPEATEGVFASVAYDRLVYESIVDVQVFAADGSFLADGTTENPTSAIRAVTPAMEAGDVVVRVAHVGGTSVPDYTLQVNSRVAVTAEQIQAWTLHRPFELALDTTGGIPPYSFRLSQSAVLPQGITLDSERARIAGTPFETGVFAFTVSGLDSGLPQNTGTISLDLKVNPELEFATPAYSGVARGRATDLSLARAGGTDPISLSDVVDGLPAGLSLTPDFHVIGTTDATGGGALAFLATDVAGATADVATTIVACDEFGQRETPLDLAAGEAVSGLWFDGLAGSSASFRVRTAKKHVKRSLGALLIGPSGTEVQSGQLTSRRGVLGLRGVTLPQTGRYFLLTPATDGGGATQLLGRAQVGLPKRGTGEVFDLDFDERVVVKFSGLEGSRFDLRAKTTDGMEMRVLFLLDGDGQLVAPESVEQENGRGGFRCRVTLPKDGNYTLLITPRPGALGSIDYTYRLRHPRGARFALSD